MMAKLVAKSERLLTAKLACCSSALRLFHGRFCSVCHRQSPSVLSLDSWNSIKYLLHGVSEMLSERLDT